MLYRRFGRTEIQMPVFSCGGMRYQYKWQDVPLRDVPPENQRNLEATIRRALELGVNHIETARGYGSSERQLGVILPTLPRDRIIVQTKIAPEEDPRTFTRHFHESLERLRLDHVDLLAIHGINNHELLWQSIRPGGCLEAARDLQQEGKARHIGFSTHAPLEVILEAIHTTSASGGVRGFDYVNLHWYYILQHNWPAIEAAKKLDMGVFIISPADKGGMLYSPPEKLTRLCAPLHPLVFNCLFCLRRPEVHTLSLGASCPADFDLQLTALPLLDRADELLPPIERGLEAAMLDAIGQKTPEALPAGLPDWEQAPGYMNIKTMLWLRHLALGWDLIEYGKMRYNLLGNGGHWFPGLSAAQLDGLNVEESLKKPLHEAHILFGGVAKKRLSQS